MRTDQPFEQPLEHGDDLWATELLMAAASTIDVSPAPAPGPHRSTPWFIPLAAAAVVVGIVAGALVWRDGASQLNPAPVLRPAGTPSVSPSVSPSKSAAAAAVDTTDAVPWSARTDYDEWVPPEPSNPMGYVDPPARWRGLAARMEAPATVTPGKTLQYVVTLRNEGTEPVDLHPCPGFRQELASGVNPKTIMSRTWRLNCDGLDPIPAGGKQRFVMRVDVPKVVDGYDLSVSWELVDGHDQGAQTWIPINGRTLQDAPPATDPAELLPQFGDRPAGQAGARD